MTDLSRIDTFRIEALRAASRRGDIYGNKAVEAAANVFLAWLATPAAKIVIGGAVVADQGNPASTTPITRSGPSMAAVMNDGQIATYPAATAADAKGFPVSDPVVLTTDDDANAAFVSRVDNADGSSAFTAKAPGVVTLTWTSGTDTLVDTLNVVAGAAVQIEVGAPVITDQP